MNGLSFHGELTVSGTTATLIPLYDDSRIPVVIETLDRVAITDVEMSGDAAATLDLFFSTSTSIPAGGRVSSQLAAANGGQIKRLAEYARGLPGEKPYFKASAAGNYRVCIRGFIERSPKR